MRALRQCVKALLLEAALTPSSIPNNVKLYEEERSDAIFIALVNVDELPSIEAALLGGITASKWSNELWTVDSVSSVKGYGPLLYRLVMTRVTSFGGSLGANPSGNTSLAKAAWDVFYQQSRVPSSGVTMAKPGDRPGYSLDSTDLEVMRARGTIQLTPEQAYEAKQLVCDLEVGGRRSELDDD